MPAAASKDLECLPVKVVAILFKPRSSFAEPVRIGPLSAVRHEQDILVGGWIDRARRISGELPILILFRIAGESSLFCRMPQLWVACDAARTA
jgi:hypothetical protein